MNDEGTLDELLDAVIMAEQDVMVSSKIRFDLIFGMITFWFFSITKETHRDSLWMQFILQTDQDLLIGVPFKEWFIFSPFRDLQWSLMAFNGHSSRQLSLKKTKIEGVQQQQWISLNVVHQRALKEMKMEVREVLVRFYIR